MAKNFPVRRLVIYLPVILLISVACTQIILASYSTLGAWSGGGFGMFSTTDIGSNRHLHIFAITPNVRRELVLNTRHKKIVDKLLVFPSDNAIESFVEKLKDIFYVPEQGPVKLEIQVWKKSFHPDTLKPKSSILNSVEIPFRD